MLGFYRRRSARELFPWILAPPATLAFLSSRQSAKKPSTGLVRSLRSRAVAILSASTGLAIMIRWDVSRFSVKGTIISAGNIDSLMAIDHGGKEKRIAIRQRGVGVITDRRQRRTL